MEIIIESFKLFFFVHFLVIRRWDTICVYIGIGIYANLKNIINVGHNSQIHSHTSLSLYCIGKIEKSSNQEKFDPLVGVLSIF